jgi:hypothetical protein
MTNVPTGNIPNRSSDKATKHELPIDAVDMLADELVAEYSNPNFRAWYCGIIYEFGSSKVWEWRRRAAEGKEPAKLFSKYVKDARIYRKNRVSQ